MPPSSSPSAYQVTVTSSSPRPDLTLHWAVNDWKQPPKSCLPPKTVVIDDKAVQTPFGNGGKEVVIHFTPDDAPKKVVFVLKEGEKWTNSGGADFTAQIKVPEASDLVGEILDAEATFEHWGLFNRFIMAIQNLDALDASGPTGMAFLLTWIRLSGMRQLDWYRKSNYQSKDIAHVQKQIAQKMADKARSARDPLNRVFARSALATLPRGGGNGDDIRMGILEVMRANGIREGHRPGIEDHFLEQWHQKLHTNTSPEDITICEAYLAFQHSGSMDDFWRVAWDNGKLTPEILATMDHPITGYPVHLPHIIPAMQHYLWILKTTHSGADLDVTATMAQGALDGELNYMISDMLANRHEWWVPGKIVEIRKRLEGYWRGAEGVSRDVMLLDIALDGYFRLLVERMDKGALERNDQINLLVLVLENACIASESEELGKALAFWKKVTNMERWTGDWAKLALAAADNTALVLENYMDTIASLVQPHAVAFQKACDIDAAYILNFSEEVVRGLPAFIIAPILRYMSPHLRAAAGVGPWQVVSTSLPDPVAAGTLTLLPDLGQIQGKSFTDAPMVVVVDSLTGNEDIPEGITAVLTLSATDVLSHIAIRARSQGVLLATCFDEGELGSVKEMEGKWVEAGTLPSGDVAVQVAIAPTNSCSSSNGDSGAVKKKARSKKLLSGKKKPEELLPAGTWVLQESAFTDELVGGKSKNLADLRSKLPAGVGAPNSVTLPFGCFEKVLASSENAAVAKMVASLEKKLEITTTSSSSTSTSSLPVNTLAELRSLIKTEVVAPKGLQDAVINGAITAGLCTKEYFTNGDSSSSSSSWEGLWDAIRGVWASKWTDRAWLSRRATGIPDEDLRMAVLLQQIIPAQYAFVLHTADPLTGKQENGCVHAEMVVGMGEALVGNYPGRALSANIDGTGAVDVGCLPSKRLSLVAPTNTTDADGTDGTTPVVILIARSDSNGEDLEDFAGAGLYDSIPVTPLDHVVVDYGEELIMWDGEWRGKMLGEVAEVGRAVEKAFGGAPQDVEGVVSSVDGKVYIVQTRPQVVS